MIFAGTPAAAVPSLEAVVAAGHEVVAVVTQADAPGKRGRTLIASPVARRAVELGLPVLKPVKARDPEFVAELAALKPEVCVVVAYGQILSRELLAVPPHGWLNLHFSALPRWRGAAPVQRAIMAGDVETATCVFELVPELDAGPVYATRPAAIRPDDSTDALLARLAVEGAELVVDVLQQVAGGAQPVPQTGSATAAPKLTVDECRIDWRQAAEQIDRLVRGAHSNPGAWTLLAGERFKVSQAHPAPTEEPLAPGALRATKRSLVVGTGSTPLSLDRVQAFGKKEMSGADWARGVSVAELKGFDA